jgi:hypothetical protein
VKIIKYWGVVVEMGYFWLAPVCFIGVYIYSFYSYKASKRYFKDESGEKAKEDLRLKSMLQGMIAKCDPDFKDKVLLNGHFVKRTELVVKITKYYSYALTLDPEKGTIDVYSYNPETKIVKTVGTFLKTAVKAVDLSLARTNYIFFDENGKQLFSVNTMGEDYAYEDENEIRFSQFEEYNQFREFFDLSPAPKTQGGA